MDAIDLHMMISSFCFFRVANRHTFGALFGRDLHRPRRQREHYRRMLGDMVVGYLAGDPGRLKRPHKSSGWGPDCRRPRRAGDWEP